MPTASPAVYLLVSVTHQNAQLSSSTADRREGTQSRRHEISSAFGSLHSVLLSVSHIHWFLKTLHRVNRRLTRTSEQDDAPAACASGLIPPQLPL